MISHRFVVLVVMLLVSEVTDVRAERPTEEWLRGSGEKLQVRLQGEVLLPDGQSASEFKLRGGLNTSGAMLPLEPTIDNHRFEVWFPVNRTRWYSMWLSVSDRNCLGYVKLGDYELRQAALDGVTLTLQSPTRKLNVKVTDQGVPVADAFVKAELGYGIDLRTRTDADGNASFGLLPEQTPNRLTAWTEAFRVGGFSFSRKPARDPNADQHEVELSRCRNQKLRFVDEQGAPVPGITFVMQMATAPPNYNYIGTNEHSTMTTDDAGEVMYPWFPDWEGQHFYVELHTDQWVCDGEPKIGSDGAAVFQLKKSKFADRKHVPGRVASANTGGGGFFVTLRSFQGEREGHSDILSTFTDPDGTFFLNVLPDATYCAWPLDAKWVGTITDLVPYRSATEEVTSPELEVTSGQQLEVMATVGPNKKPYSNLSIHFRRVHSFTWDKDGQERHGTSGPQWWATTNENGVATTSTLPGELIVSAYTPLWSTKEKVDVSSAEPAVVRLHREVEGKRLVTGRLILSDGLPSTLENATIAIGSIDGNTDDQQEMTVHDDGSFSFETQATEVGLFGYTHDGRAAGAIVVNDFDSPVQLQLLSTLDYHGQLLGDADRPLVEHRVQAVIRMEAERDYDAPFLKSFEATRFQTKTDALGNFTFPGLPRQMKVSLFADAIDGSDNVKWLDEVYLEPNEPRPRAISRLLKTTTAVETPLAQRYERTLRDGSIMGFRTMIITSGASEAVTEFVNRNFVDHHTNEQISRFMQLTISGSAEDLSAADLGFLKEKKWPLASQDRVFACAIDASGNELGRIDLEISQDGAADRAAEFVNQYAPPQLDAEQKWKKAFDEAKKSDRKVWACIGGRYCGPCFRLARWQDDHRDMLAQDYVMLKIDDFHDQNGRQVAEHLTRGRQHGIPFHAIFDVDGEMLIDSAGPLGNIGHPSGYEGKKYLRKMLLETRQRLTDAAIDQLVDSLSD